MIDEQTSPEVPAGAGRWNPQWRVAAVCLVLAAITFAVFGQTLTHQFVNYDDDVYVYDNPVVARGLTAKGAVWAFAGAHADNWHPLTWLSHMLDCQLYGLHPGGHHLTNVLLHTGTVIMLFLILRQMTGVLWRSAFVAAVFAIHPLRVESVAWVAERKDVLSGLFFILAIGAYVNYARRPWSLARYGLVMLLFALGLMCKPMLVTLPLVLLLLDYWPLKREASVGRLVVEKLPLLALSAASCVATLLAQQRGIQSMGSFSAPMRLANALVGCMVYLGQMVYPAKLVPFYPYPLHGLPTLEVALAGMLLAGLSVVAWNQRRVQPWVFFGWLWYLVMLLPVAGLIQVGDQAHADRYTYLPQVGLYVAITWTIAEWGARRHAGCKALGGLMVAVVGVLMVCAWKQASYWTNGETLWTHTLTCFPDNYEAQFHLGEILRQEGKMDEAISYYRKAVESRPDYAQAHDNLGHALLLKGQVNEAISHFQQALQIQPGLANAHNNLGQALRLQGRVDEAIIQYKEALQIRPNLVDAHVNLGHLLLQRGEVDEAIAHYNSALEIRPNYALAHNNLGNALLQKGQIDEAISQMQRALQINPGSAKIHSNLGGAFLQKGNVTEAITQFQQAVKIDPGDPAGQNNLAWLLATWPDGSVRNGGKAVVLAERANQLAGGGNPVILCTLAAAYAEAGRYSEAVETAQRALTLGGVQSNARMSEQLQVELKLFKAGTPYHMPEQKH